MRLATVATPDGATCAGVSRAAGSGGPASSASDWLALPAADLSELLARPDWREVAATALSAAPDATVVCAPDAVLLNPLPRPAKVICCGLNYADHITEMGRELPRHPTLFAKYADTLIGPSD